MAKLIRTSGELQTIVPEDGKQFTLKELQGYVGGMIEAAPMFHTGLNLDLIVNEEGRLIGLPHNPAASLIGQQDIVGDAVLLRREEWD